MHRSVLACILVILPALPVAAQATGSKAAAPARITTASGLAYVDVVPGSGPSPRRGQTCVVHYTGWLSKKGNRGKQFDSSRNGGAHFSFQVGVDQVIKGWDEGVISMKKGGRRTLYVPAALGYGDQGAGGDIPPGADLIFDVELLDLK